MFIKDRPVSSLGVFVFEFLGASFSRFGCFVFDRCFVFEFWVLRFRDLGASCFDLRFRVLRFRNYLTTVVAYDRVDTLSDYVFWPEINVLIKFSQQEILLSPFENKASVATKKSC